MNVDELKSKIDDDFARLLENVFIYGAGVMLTTYIDGQLQSRIVPIEEYAELGESLKHIEQNRVDKK